MNTSTNSETSERVLFEGNADPPQANEPLSVIIRLHRVKAVVNALGDALQKDGDEYSDHLAERATVCDLLSDEVAAITIELIEEDEGKEGS